MRLFVQSGRKPVIQPDAEDAWILLEDTWNDYSYRTLYVLYRQVDSGLLRVGSVKILRLGQQEVVTPLALGEIQGGVLPEDCISRGASLDYYISLAELGPDRSRQVLRDLRDTAMDPTLRDPFASEEGLRKSLHRDEPDPEPFYEDARGVISAGGPPPDEDGFTFAFAPGPEAEPVEFSFHRSRRSREYGEVGPSRRIIVLVGANGVGKTQLLARLARVAYTPPLERAAVADSGHFDEAVAFPSIVAVSYSAFDTFRPPALQGDTPADVAAQLTSGTGRYAYCGTRDLAATFLNPPEPVRLLPPEAQAALFAERIQQVRDLDRFKLLAQAMATVFQEDSLQRLLPPLDPEDENPPTAVERLEAVLGADPAATFLGLSSGHMIVLHVLASLAATLRRRGLALIDEPETHLHPPLLAALMTGVRKVIDRLGAYAIIATHSPVVAQEVLGSQVKVVEFGVAGPLVRPVGVQTFGENTGTLTREIFGLHTGATDYRHVLDRLAEAFGDAKAIEDALGEPLSSQALAHVTAAIARRGDAVA